MITRPERKRRHVVETAVALSIAIHMLFGLLVPWTHGLRAAFPTPQKTPEMTALSDVVTLERRTVPRPEPRTQVRPQQPQKPRVQVVPKQVAVAEPPPPRAERHELTSNRPKPNAPVAPKNDAPREGAPKESESKKIVAYVEPQPKAPAAKKLPYSQQQLADLQRQFANTIAQERAHTNPVDVQTAPPAGMKSFKMQIDGIHDELRSGEGYIGPTRAWQDGGYNYYYIHYEIVWQDGTYESNDVPWPVRFRPFEDPLLHNSHHFPMPCPVPGWTLPNQQGFAQLPQALRLGLFLCFPGRYADSEFSG